MDRQLSREEEVGVIEEEILRGIGRAEMIEGVVWWLGKGIVDVQLLVPAACNCVKTYSEGMTCSEGKGGRK